MIPQDYVHSYFFPIPEVTTPPANMFMLRHTSMGDFITFNERMRSQPDRCYHEHLLCDLILSHMVDTFLAYLTDLLALVYRYNPDIIPGKVKSQYEGRRLDGELLFSLARDQAEGFSRKGLNGLKSELKRLDIPLFDSEEDAAEMDYLYEIRNVIVHNFGAVTLKFKKRFPSYPAEVGNLLMLEFDVVKEVSIFLANCVCDIDTRAVSLFNLPHSAVQHPSVASDSDPGAAKVLPIAIGGVWSSTCFSADVSDPGVAENLPIGASIGFPWTRHTPLCRRRQK